jgi:hypothetical protein
MISISDLSDQNKVNKHLEDNLFIDSTVTLSDEEYLKGAIKDYLIYHVLVNNNLVDIDTDPNNLLDAMMAQSLSFNRKLLTHIVDSCVLDVLQPTQLNDEQKEAAKKQNEAADKIMADVKNVELSGIIKLVKETRGSYRVCIEPIPEDATAFNLVLKKPVVLNVASLDATSCSLEELSEFLKSFMLYSAGYMASLSIPNTMLPQSIKDIFAIVDPVIVDNAFAYARSMTAVNTINMTTSADPFQDLFNSML